MTTLRAGYAEVEITPPVGLDLTGFALRRQPATGVHDPLFAKAVILDDGRIRVGIVSCDLLGLTNAYTQKVRTAIARRRVLPAAHLLVACTHTHSGPASMPLRGCGAMDAKWLRWLHRQIVGVVAEAARSLQPVTVHYGHRQAQASRVRWLAAFDRPVTNTGTRRTKPRLADISVIQFRHGARPLVNIVHYPCHPVIMGPANRQVSADFCGAVTSYLKKKTGAPALFLNGAAGNLNPRALGHGQHPTSFRRVAAVGELLGRTAWQALESARPINDTRLRVAFRRVRIPLRIPTAKELQQTVRRYRSELRQEGNDPVQQSIRRHLLAWARAATAAAKSGRPRATVVALQELAVGRLVLVALGGEPFDRLGERLQRVVGPPCLVVGYANGNVGYLPDREACAAGGYEVNDAHKFYGLFGATSQLETILARAAKQLLGSLDPQR